ncbi:hypothetical protein OG394_04790 [Kribbella sp. NBC_01245]|uniref:hypothetical protein n=1 Tax=Kribbella sp. NBC_01245 TaxID=2903578 RepID=UPI002E2965D9|nr:hypothetical protein [Kribbella sp. NBC_01245]
MLTVVVVFAILALCLGTLAATLQSLDGEGQASGPISLSIVLRHGCAAGVAVVAFYGLASLIGAGVIPLVLLLGVTCPVVVARWWPRGRSLLLEQLRERVHEPSVAPSDDSGEIATPAVEAMTVPELCSAWRRSFIELQRTGSAETRSVIAAHRQQILEELERRNPDGFGDWLASGARAPSDPAKYLLDRPGGKHLSQ